MRFKLFGTEIYISFLFAAVICFMIATDRTGLVLPTLFSVILHELGHLIAMWICESEPKSIKLVPASISITRGFSRRKHGDLFIALSGPIINIIMFFTILVNFLVTKNRYSFDCALINLALFVFNMLPVSGLDGGTVLRIIIEQKSKNPHKADRILKTVTFIVGMLIFVLGITLVIRNETNLTVFIVSIYIIMSAFIRA